MDRALIVCLCVCAVVGFAVGMPMTAQAYSVYADGLPSSTYTDLFADVLNNCSSNADYVFFRGGQYEYYMAVGDLTYLSGSFRGSNVTVYKLQTYSSYSSSNYTFTSSTVSSFSLSSDNRVVYSNLGAFPNFIERNETYEYTTLYILVVVCLCLLVRPIFSFTLRKR